MGIAMYWLICIFVFIATCALTMYVDEVTIIRVNGKSMLPALKHGQFYFLTRKNFYPLIVDGIYVIQAPFMIRPAIKRLTKKVFDSDFGGFYLWFEGDNAEESFDSRDYGWIRDTDVIGKVITNK